MCEAMDDLISQAERMVRKTPQGHDHGAIVDALSKENNLTEGQRAYLREKIRRGDMTEAV